MPLLRWVFYLAGVVFGTVVGLATVAVATFGLALGLVAITAMVWGPLVLAWGIDLGLRNLGLWSNYWLVLLAVVVFALLTVPQKKESGSVEPDSRPLSERDDP